VRVRYYINPIQITSGPVLYAARKPR